MDLRGLRRGPGRRRGHGLVRRAAGRNDGRRMPSSWGWASPRRWPASVAELRAPLLPAPGPARAPSAASRTGRSSTPRRRRGPGWKSSRSCRDSTAWTGCPKSPASRCSGTPISQAPTRALLGRLRPAAGTRMFRHPQRRATQMVELSDLQAALTDPGRSGGLQPPGLPPSRRATTACEVRTVGDPGRRTRSSCARPSRTATAAPTSWANRPARPRSGSCTACSCRRGTPRRISERRPLLVATDETEQIVGGVVYRETGRADRCSWTASWSAPTLAERGIAGAILADFCTRVMALGFTDRQDALLPAAVLREARIPAGSALGRAGAVPLARARSRRCALRPALPAGGAARRRRRASGSDGRRASSPVRPIDLSSQRDLGQLARQFRIAGRRETLLPQQQRALGPQAQLALQAQQAEHVRDQVGPEAGLQRLQVAADRRRGDLARRGSTPAARCPGRSRGRASARSRRSPRRQPVASAPGMNDQGQDRGQDRLHHETVEQRVQQRGHQQGRPARGARNRRRAVHRSLQHQAEAARSRRRA